MVYINKTKAIIKLISIIVAASYSAGCAVKMAATHKGVDTSEILSCQNEACILALRDTEILVSEEMGTGKQVTYRSLRKRGSTSRAVMHGVLDVATVGIWEFAGTPIEHNNTDQRFHVYRVNYDNDANITNASIEASS